EAPDTRPQRLDVRDDAGQLRLARDLDHLIHRGDHADRIVRLVADVTRVGATVLRCDARELDQLVGLRVAAWSVERAARQPEGARLHAGTHQLTHALQLRGVRGTVRHAQYLAADGAVRHEQRHVHARARGLDLTTLLDQVDGAATIRIHEDGRDALHQQRRGRAQLRVGEGAARVRVGIDEAGCDEEAG